MVVLGAMLGTSACAAGSGLDVPYDPTPLPVMKQMLKVAHPTSEDSLYDLGSGDGRIVISAADRYGTPAVGVEIDSSRVALARRKAEAAGVDHLVRFVRGDLFEANIRPASVVTLFLLPSVNLELRPKLFRQLRPGAQVVSHEWGMGEWRPDSVVEMPSHNSTVYYWVIPADVAGVWRVTTRSGDTLTVEIHQKFQQLWAAACDDGFRVETARIRGSRIHLTLRRRGRRGTVELSGAVSGSRMNGDGWAAVRTQDAHWPLDRWGEDTGGRTGACSRPEGAAPHP